jgi:hypothetical protein
MKSSIPSEERFKQKSNLLRLIIFQSTIPEFHFHGIKSLRSLRISKILYNYFLSFFRNFFDRFSTKGTSFLRSVIGVFKNSTHSLFNFSSNTYSYELVNSMTEAVIDHIHFPFYNSSKKYIHT